jgi:hypothetical protein
VSRLETAPIAGGSSGETVNRVEESLTAGHSGNAMGRLGRKEAA